MPLAVCVQHENRKWPDDACVPYPATLAAVGKAGGGGTKSARRRGYQIATTARLMAALSVAGLSITETERGYDWQMDDLQGHATTVISAVADALSTLRQLRDEEISLATRSTIAPTDARSVAQKLGQLQAQLIQLSCLHNDDDLLPVYQQCTAQFADEVVHDLYQVIHLPSPTS
jgi:hypothetical protein